jgi:hypothetical protein
MTTMARESIFKTPESATGRVGVIGSGQVPTFCLSPAQFICLTSLSLSLSLSLCVCVCVCVCVCGVLLYLLVGCYGYA